jgi:hypothetical protein
LALPERPKPEQRKGGDLLAVLDQLHADSLTNGGVGLLGTDADLLDDDALGERGAAEGVGLRGREERR